MMPYVPPHHYTPEELLDAEIEDLLVDYRCAVRDGLYEYAAEVAGKIVLKRIACDNAAAMKALKPDESEGTVPPEPDESEGR